MPKFGDNRGEGTGTLKNKEFLGGVTSAGRNDCDPEVPLDRTGRFGG